MAEVHQFAYGWFTPVVAFVLSYLGALLGLLCAARARRATSRARRGRWLVSASVSIGGAGVWLMQFMAMLGFDVVGTPVRYDPVLTGASLLIALVGAGVGLFVVGYGDPSALRVLAGGLFAGAGAYATHYTGMAAVHLAGSVTYDPALLVASAVSATVAATVAMWFSVTLRGWPALLLGALVMATATCGMHYTGMSATRVRLDPAGGTVTGLSPILLIVPISLVASAAVIGLAFSGLQAMTEEEFNAPPVRRPAAVPVTPVRWAGRAVPQASSLISPAGHPPPAPQPRIAATPWPPPAAPPVAAVPPESVPPGSVPPPVAPAPRPPVPIVPAYLYGTGPRAGSTTLDLGEIRLGQISSEQTNPGWRRPGGGAPGRAGFGPGQLTRQGGPETARGRAAPIRVTD